MKCINCGNEINEKDKYCESCGIDPNNVEIIREVIPKKKNKGILVIFLSFLILLAGVGCWFIFSYQKTEEEKTNKEEIVIDEDSEILINNYIITIPDNFTMKKNNKNRYFIEKEFYFIYNEYLLSFDDIINNKEFLLDELEEQGYIIDEFESKKVDENNYIIIKSRLDDIEYGFIIYEFDEESNIMITITSNYLSRFDEKWFDEVLNFLKTARKI